MFLEGVFEKMTTEWQKPIQYYLDCSGQWIIMNQLINKKIKFTHKGYQCFNCESGSNIFAMGYCYKCFSSVVYTQPFILKPELSKAHLGIEEIDLEVEKELQLQPHYVYLANTGSIKVGVTRKKQVPTRWIDQGASYAMPIVETENRYLAGITEVAIAKEISDKTNFRKMLTNQIETIDLEAWKNKLKEFIPQETVNGFIEKNEILEFEYPVEKYPLKIKSITFKKHTEIEGILTGIRGQYLIFNNELVFNVRNHEGYAFTLSI